MNRKGFLARLAGIVALPVLGNLPVKEVAPIVESQCAATGGKITSVLIVDRKLSIAEVCEMIRKDSSELADSRHAFNIIRMQGALDMLTSPDNYEQLRNTT